MDVVRAARRIPRFRPNVCEALEQRTLLSLTLLHDFDRAETTPADITGAGGNVFFVTRGPQGASDLDVKNAAGVTLLEEFPATNSASSQQPAISSLTAAGSNLFFLANVGQGQQLWVSNGTRAGTRLVENYGASALPGDLTAVGNALFFSVTEGLTLNSETVLFKSDGTTAGTVAVPTPPINVEAGSFVGPPVSFRGALYFTLGDQLLMTDGTTTHAVVTFSGPSSPDMPPASLGDLTVAGGLLYFTSSDASQQGEDLYVSDGTGSGTRLLHDFIIPGSPGGALSNLTAVGSQVFFVVADAAHGPSLWATNGTAAGTRFVRTIGLPSSGNSSSGTVFSPPILTTIAAGSRLFFTTPPLAPNASGALLWGSDGTTAGTTVLGVVNQGTPSSFASPFGQFAALGGALFFTNFDPAHGMELWRSDGTVAGTRLFRDLNSGPASSFPSSMTVANNTLYFSATAGTGASALWASNGSPTGTHIVAAFPSQPNGDGLFVSSSTVSSAVLGNTILLAANDGVATELWKTDGTRAGTRMIRVLNLGVDNVAPDDFTTVGNKVFFDATQNQTNTLWVTNGTAAGTTPIGGFNGLLSSFTPFGDMLAFVVTSPDFSMSSLWVTDGTASGTRPIGGVAGTISDPTLFQGKLAFFETTSDSSVSSLWLSDGTAHGSTLVAIFPPASPSSFFGPTPPSMVVLGNKLLISAPPLPGGLFMSFTTLWVSNGTPAGTVPLAAVPPIDDVGSLTVFQNRVYFATDGLNQEIWLTDGTNAGTHKVANVGTDFSSVSSMLVAGPRLYIFTTDESDTSDNTSAGLYVSDGTAGGTTFLHEFANEMLEGPTGLPNGNIAMVLSSFDPGTPSQIWVSNGAAPGTQPVGGAGPGVPGPGLFGSSGVITPIHGRFYFQVTDPLHGTELWRSDGTLVGTSLVQDIFPGPGSSNAVALAELNGRLIVAADDGLHGVELLSGPIPLEPGLSGSVRPTHR